MRLKLRLPFQVELPQMFKVGKAVSFLEKGLPFMIRQILKPNSCISNVPLLLLESLYKPDGIFCIFKSKGILLLVFRRRFYY